MKENSKRRRGLLEGEQVNLACENCETQKKKKMKKYVRRCILFSKERNIISKEE